MTRWTLLFGKKKKLKAKRQIENEESEKTRENPKLQDYEPVDGESEADDSRLSSGGRLQNLLGKQELCSF